MATKMAARPGEGLGRWGTLVDRVTHGIERADALDGLARASMRVATSALRAGRLKDVLSGTWMGHPAHPMLTDVTVGCWAASFILDLLARDGTREASDALIGVGVLSAIPTAATGASDYVDAMAKEDRRIGAVHAVGNTAALVCYALSYVARKRGARGAGFALSAIGAAAMTGSAFLGGHLAYRRGLGVDQTVFDSPPQAWTPVLDERDLPERKPVRVRVERSDVLLYRKDGRVYAIAARCSHRGGPLQHGTFAEGTVTCPWHLSTFSLEDGTVVRGPATAPQPCYETRNVDGTIEVRPNLPS